MELKKALLFPPDRGRYDHHLHLPSLKQYQEEIEAISEIFGSGCTLAGFYSYGEVCPFHQGGRTQLHNQTMTITILSE